MSRESGVPTFRDALKKADAVVVMTDKDEFFKLDLAKMAAAMRRPIMVDAANIFDPAAAVKAGFTYVAIGRGFEWIGNGRTRKGKK
jgi:UDP-N-acetyl-D-mannosaminuronate dehydrogenase